MPALFILAIVAAGLAVVAFVVKRAVSRKLKTLEAAEQDTDAKSNSSREDEYDSYSYRHSTDSSAPRLDDFRLTVAVARWAMIGLFALAGIFTFWSSATVVSTKNIGVVTEFNRPTGENLSNGFHFVLPWQKVTELDGTIQTDNHIGFVDGDWNKANCTKVRIAQQAVACVDNSIRWRLRPEAADRLFQEYRDFDNIRSSLVTRQLSEGLNAELEGYDPLATDEAGNSTAPSQEQIAENTKRWLIERIGRDIEVLDVIAPLTHFDGNTQGRINALQQEIGNTRIATQREQTAKAEAAANGELAASVSKDPNVLVSKCLDTLNAMVEANQPIPAGFSCWPGGSSAVVVPSASRPGN